MTYVDDAIKRLGSLQDGWFDGMGLAYTSAHLSRLQKLLKHLVAGTFNDPAVVPCSSGDVEVIWDVGQGRVVIYSSNDLDTVNICAVLNGTECYSVDVSAADLSGVTAAMDCAWQCLCDLADTV